MIKTERLTASSQLEITGVIIFQQGFILLLIRQIDGFIKLLFSLLKRLLSRSALLPFLCSQLLRFALFIRLFSDIQRFAFVGAVTPERLVRSPLAQLSPSDCVVLHNLQPKHAALKRTARVRRGALNAGFSLPVGQKGETAFRRRPDNLGLSLEFQRGLFWTRGPDFRRLIDACFAYLC